MLNSKKLLEELNSIYSLKNDLTLELKCSNVIQSTINLFDLLNKSYSPDQILKLKRKFFLSLKNSDPNIFLKTIKKTLKKK